MSAIRRNIFISCDPDSFAWQNPTCLQSLAVASSFSDDIVFLRMPGTQRQRSERLQASGPSSLVQMTSGPFPPAELFFFLFLEGG